MYTHTHTRTNTQASSGQRSWISSNTFTNFTCGSNNLISIYCDAPLASALSMVNNTVADNTMARYATGTGFVNINVKKNSSRDGSELRENVFRNNSVSDTSGTIDTLKAASASVIYMQVRIADRESVFLYICIRDLQAGESSRKRVAVFLLVFFFFCVCACVCVCVCVIWRWCDCLCCE